MKNVLFFILIVTSLGLQAQETVIQQQPAQDYYEYQIVTSVESIIPAGIGRSRLIANPEERNFNNYTHHRTKADKKNKSNRKDIRIDEFDETKLMNFFDITGIRFENIASNDALVSSKLNELAANGWELAFVTSGVESDAGDTDGQGLFITRYIFKRIVKAS